MPYVTLPIMPVFQQLTLDQILYGEVPIRETPIFWNETNTRTKYVKTLKRRFTSQFDFYRMASLLHQFNQKHRRLFEAERSDLYTTFLLPKKSGGTRRIDAPNDDLMTALRELKNIFEKEFSPSKHRPSLYHTTAFAYVKGRCHKDSLVRHQKNKSHWYLKLDFTNFFGSTTKAFVMNMLKRIFPFSEMFSRASWERELDQAIDLCFLNGGLPQGTPISPMLTNLIMLPIDYEICRGLRRMEQPTETRPDGNSFVYTRYADDITISGKRSFQFREVQDMIRTVLDHFEAPYVWKEEKTHYGSRAGNNWNLGLMINKDNQITIGWERKRRLRAVIDDYMTRHEKWSVHDVQVLAGQINYYTSVEPEYIDGVMRYYSEKYGSSVMRRIKLDLAG